ncbi:Alpha/Beta hydrolase protein [Obelidium mucronatum]|nr:Alpha/Beta hydrolase protein [Obelidium mucronatum]
MSCIAGFQSKSANGYQAGYFSHVGLMGDFATRLLRLGRGFGFKEDSFASRAMMLLSGRFESLGVPVVETTHGLWVGTHGAPPSLDTHVLMHIHGGGYVMGTPWIVVKHSNLLAQEYQRITKKPLAVFCIFYPLCPENSYDDAFNACLGAYMHLVGLGYTNISVAGDSAGGHAAINLVSILASKDYASFIQPVSAIAYCPWVDPHISVLPPNYPNEVSFKHDTLSVEGSRYMAARVRSTVVTQYRVTPLHWSDTDLLTCVPKRGGLLVLYGGGDVLRGGIDAFVDRLQNIVGADKVVKKRYPFMPHEFDLLFLSILGPGNRAAMDSIKESAKFLRDSLGK